MLKSFTTTLPEGIYSFPVMVYDEKGTVMDFQLPLSNEDIESILKFLLEVENLGIIWAFQEYSQSLYDRINASAEEVVLEAGCEDYEYGICFPVELTDEADRIRQQD